MTRRPSSRVVLLDPADRVLLIRLEETGFVIDGVPMPSTYWITPGGGLEAGESHEDAAYRELFEETGIDDLVLGPMIFEQEGNFSLAGEIVRAVEHYFVGWISMTDVSFDHIDDIERSVSREPRWWTRRTVEAAAPNTTIFPETFAGLYDQALATPR